MDDIAIEMRLQSNAESEAAAAEAKATPAPKPTTTEAATPIDGQEPTAKPVATESTEPAFTTEANASQKLQAVLQQHDAPFVGFAVAGHPYGPSPAP